MRELTKQEFFDRLAKSLDSGCKDDNLSIKSITPIGDEPIILEDVESSDYFFSQSGGIVTFLFPTNGLEAELNVDAYSKNLLSFETREGDYVPCGEYGE
jgi:hypothetical protein